MRTSLAYFFYAFLLISTPGFIFAGDDPKEQKVLICGVCRNVEGAMPHNKKNIETLGRHFADYAVIIYENNSEDNTGKHLRIWSSKNPRVHCVSEYLTKDRLPRTREEKIARARNIVLSIAKDPKYKDFKYLIMADLDFRTPWPISEILETIKSPIEWDCVSANGVIWSNGDYFDRYAFRDKRYPLGSELLAGEFWHELTFDKSSWFKVRDENWLPVYAAFGGLAIYKTETLLKFTYSANATEDLERYYEKIISNTPRTHHHIQKYLKMIEMESQDLDQIPVIFRYKADKNVPNICCEHVPLHASMALNGHDKFYVNPKMIMYYEVRPPGSPPKEIKEKKKKEKKSFLSFLKRD